jgi:hypothetical protein
MKSNTPTTTRQPPTSTSPTLTTRLHELISACFTAVWVQTHEPHEAAREITDLCRAESWRLGIWNCDSGVQFPIEQIAIPGVTETQDPLAVIRALPQVSQGAGTTVLLFENLHRFLGSVELIQAVARQAITGKHNRAFIVVLAPVTQIPPELDKLFVCVDHELPDHAQLAEIARGVATQNGELPSGDELPRVIDAAKGLTRSEAENAYSLSLVRHGTLKAETLWEIKAGQLKKSGLVSIHRGTESFQQLGGLDNLKAFCLRAMRRQVKVRPATGPAVSSCSLLPAAARVSSRRHWETKLAGRLWCSMSAHYWEVSWASRRATSGRH